MRAGACLMLAACAAACAPSGPLPLDQAERRCLREARAAAGPRGVAEARLGPGVSLFGVGVVVSSDWLQGRDPAEVFDTCVHRLAGVAPSRPLARQPGWAG